MRKIFKKGRSSDSGARGGEREEFRARSLSTPNTHFSSDILHDASRNYVDGRADTVDDVFIETSQVSRTTTLSSDSKGLSDTDTLYYDKEQRLQLQDTYEENFSVYLPYVLRRMALESENHRYTIPGHRNGEIEIQTTTQDEDYDDETQETQSTIFEMPTSESEQAVGVRILQQPISKFTTKRRLIIVNEFMKNNTYVFASEESFNLFKVLKSNNKRDRKQNVIIYDKDGSIRRLSNVKPEELSPSEGLVDTRTHIIPVSHKLKGEGLPLFKIQVPYLSSFRRNAPFMVFKRYKEFPPRPSAYDSDDQRNDEQAETFEQYTYCTVRVKHHREVKRYTFTFYPGMANSFRLLLFQSNTKPFSDFIYKQTRFRIIGTVVVSGYLMPYNPELKLMVVDDDKPGLCDHIINKKPNFEFSSIIKKRRKSSENIKPVNSAESNASVEYDENDPTTYPNPHPDYANPILKDSSLYNPRSYSCDKLPPFGMFKDSSVYMGDDFAIIPKRYRELGRIDVYQDTDTVISESLNSTLSVDDDTLVLNMVLLTMREVNIRNTAKSHQVRGSGVGLGRAQSIGNSLLIS